MALPHKKKKILSSIGEAVQKAAGADTSQQIHSQIAPPLFGKKTGRPSPRSGNIIRQTLLLTEETAERLTMALAEEQIKRRKTGDKVDKSSLIEEMILKWLDEKTDIK